MSTVPASMTPFYHGTLKTKIAESMVSNEGDYLFRDVKGGGYIVSVIFKTKPAHLKIEKASDGTLTVNGKPTSATNLREITQLLLAPNKAYKWPASLITGIYGLPVELDVLEEEAPPPFPQPEETPSSHDVAPSPSKPKVQKAPSSMPPKESEANPMPKLKRTSDGGDGGGQPKDYSTKGADLSKLKSSSTRQSVKAIPNSNTVPISLKGQNAPTSAPSKVLMPISSRDLNSEVRIYGVSCPGTLKYFGPKRGEGTFGKDAHCGIELEDPSSTHDGEINGHRYFECEPLKGILVPAALVVRASEYVSDGLNEGVVLEDTFPDFPNEAMNSFDEVETSMSEHYHGDITQADAEALILAQPKAPAGTYLFAKDFISVLQIHYDEGNEVQRPRVVHRSVVTDASTGFIAVIGRVTTSKTYETLEVFLRNRQPGWPTRITLGVEGYGTVTEDELNARVDAEIEAEQRAEQKLKAQEKQDISAHRVKTRQSMELYKEETFVEQDRADAINKELHSPNVVAARAKAHAIVVANRKQVLLQNKRESLIDGHRKKFDKHQEILKQALVHAAALSNNQPVSLDSDDEDANTVLGFVDSDDSDNDDDVKINNDTSVEVWKMPEKKKGSFKKPSVLATAHEAMDKVQAYAWLTDGGIQQGKHLLRKVKVKSKELKVKYALDVIDQGAPITLDIEQDDTGGFFREFRVNGEPTGQTSIDSVLQRLRTGMQGLPKIISEYSVAPAVSLNRKESKRVIKTYKQSMKKKK